MQNHHGAACYTGELLMKVRWDEVSIYLRTGYTDMRKQINSLAVLVQEELKMNPVSGNLFLFCGKGRSLLRILYWDKNGFCLWSKRLVQDKFPWPLHAGEVKEITRREMRMLLTGIDFFKAHNEKNLSL
jgi:transposase